MEEIKVYNTLTKEKEVFKPITPGEVKIYVCGVTPYNHPHIGNARPAVTWDIIRRYLEYIGYKVKFVQNFTDVDDKIINKANAEGTDWKTISDRYIDAYFKVMDALHVRRTDVYPRVSDHMDDIIHMVEELIKNGHAYVLGGDVYYDISTFKDYGKLSGRKVEDLLAGARIEVNDEKRNPGDFALWKAAKPGEPFWESPWGKGRPGWHIECSAMSTHYLGNTIDFHGGGSDLIFPHHENEIAQSEAANGVPFAKYWMHNAFLNIDNKKMSKSLGNFFTVRDISKEYDLQVLRFFMLSAHYRNPINFSHDLMESAKNGLDRIVTAVGNLTHLAENAQAGAMTDEEKALLEKTAEMTAKFEAAMEDDFNTADAIAAVFELVKFANSNSSAGNTAEYLNALKAKITALTDVLGLVTEKEAEMLDEEIENLIAQRQQARKDRDFAKADEIRDTLLAKGIVLEDTREGVRWKRA